MKKKIEQKQDQEPIKKPEPYYTNENDLRNICGVHTLALQYLNKIAIDFKLLSLGNIAMSDLQQLERRDFKDIKAKYFKNIESDIENVKSEIVRANLMAGVEETFRDFQTKTETNITAFQAIAFFASKHYPLSVNHFTVKDGIVTFSDENKEFLKNEFCTVFIDLPAKQKFLRLQDETLKGLQELKKMLVENNIGSLFSQPGDVGLFDEGREDVIIGDPEFVEFVKI